MSTGVQTKQIRKNMLLSMMAQAVSFVVSVVLNLLLPKFIDVYQYSYWQTFLLYVSYVPVLHLGFLDGLMLRYSQYDYDDLNKPLIRAQFKLFLVLELLFAAILVLLAFCFLDGILQQISIFVGIAVVSTNLFTYTSYTFQLTNRIGKYAQLLIVQKVLLGIGVMAVVLCGGKNFFEICIAYFVSSFITIGWGYFNNRLLYFGQSSSFGEGVHEFRINVSAGALLLVANLSAMLLVGGAKMVVHWHFDELLFGQVAFSFNVSNLFLTFVTAASIALFPSLKRIDQEQLPKVYSRIRKSISPLLFCCLLLYFPGSFILKKWLPNYSGSMEYLGLLLPIVVFTSKIALLTNNYLKAFRKERLMLIINLSSVAVAALCFGLSAYVLESIQLIILSLVLVMAVVSLISEFVVMKLIGKRFVVEMFFELVLTVVFLISVAKLPFVTGLIVYAASLLLYWLFCYLKKNE